MGKKFILIVKETLHLIRKEKILFLAPILLALAILSILIYQAGPAVIIAFIYAGG